MASFSVASPLRTSSNHNSALGSVTPAAKGKKGSGQDRFIPPRGAIDTNFLASTANSENEESSASGVDVPTPSKRQYVRRLAEGLNVTVPGEEKVNSTRLLLDYLLQRLF